MKQFNPFKDTTYIEKNGRIYQFHWKNRYDPVTALIIGGAAMAAMGKLQQGQAANQEGKDAQKMMEYNAKVEEQKAKQLEAKALFDQQRQAQEAERTKGTLTANIGMSGTDTSVGSPLLVQAKQASESELENLMIGYNGQVGATAARNQAKLDIMQGKIYRNRGQNAQTGSFFGAGSSLLTGFGNAGGFA